MNIHPHTDESVFGVDEIPTYEREDYLLSLPPEQLWFALDATMNRACRTGDEAMFWLLMYLATLGRIASGHLVTERDAKIDINLMLPAIVRRLNEQSIASGGESRTDKQNPRD